eukprot:4522324-Pyramimonas_sp.AAC.1
MSRHNGEPRVAYISRGKRWWKLVSKLGPNLMMSGDLLGSLLLDHAGLSPSENLMVVSSTGRVTCRQGQGRLDPPTRSYPHHQKGRGDSGKSSTLTQWTPRNPSKGKGKARYIRPPQAYHAADVS